MKKLIAIACSGVLAFCAFPTELKADDDKFLDKVKEFVDKAQDRLDDVTNKINAYFNSPQIQAKLEQIRAEHRAHMKEALTKLLAKITKFRHDIAPVIEARIQMRFMEFHAKMVDRLKIFKTQAAKWYEAELDKIISKLPAEVQAKVREIRSSPEYQERRAEAAKKIETYVLEHLHSAASDFRENLRDFIDDRLDELNARLQARIDAL